jgi:hypothetical protein
VRFHPLRRRHPQIRFTRVCLTRHLPASEFGYSLAGLLPANAPRSEDREPSMGFTLQGLSLRPGAPVSRPLLSCRFSALPAFSSEDEKVGSSAATSEPCSGRRTGSFGGSNPPSEPRPSWVASPSEALASPRWHRLPGTSPHALSLERPPKWSDESGAPGSRSTGEVRRTHASATPPTSLGSVASARLSARFRRGSPSNGDRHRIEAS